MRGTNHAQQGPEHEVEIMTAVGPISLAKQYLRNTIAGTATFQTATGTASEAAALAHVYDEEIPAKDGDYSAAELINLRPFAIVESLNENSFKMVRTSRGVGSNFRDSGSLAIYYEANVDDELSFNENKLAFINTIGALILDISDLAGQSGYLDINNLELKQFGFCHEDDIPKQGDHMMAMMMIDWGVS